MCRVELHATKPCVLRQLCCFGEVRRTLMNFAQRHPFTVQAFTLQVGQAEFARRRSPPFADLHSLFIPPRRSPSKRSFVNRTALLKAAAPVSRVNQLSLHMKIFRISAG